ncbi:MAG TPA: SURF1 family cytochrome oxidase biogenesis protein [Caulobacteraceae bacterium]|nr:SURF1 family cytochrome oxidase biogenesis protein [Caulobacteraceae bacterium]
MRDADEPPRGPTLLGTGLSLICLAILISLGVWQVQRLKWKEGLLTHIAALRTEAPRPLAQVLKSGDVNFVRVAFDCPDLMSRPRLRLYGLQDGQTGYRLMAACPAPPAAGAASLLVDLGFFAQSLSDPTPTACLKTPAPRPLTGPAIGVLRAPDPRSFVAPSDQPQQNQWFTRDLPAMAAALGAGAPAPAFVALEQSPGAALDGCPVAHAPLPSDLPNNHLQYAITWFGLAAALVGVYVAMLFRRRPN